MRSSAWTPEREARAVRLYLREGFTASEVADALGGGLTRGAVIGKIRRLGFMKRERSPQPEADPACAMASRPRCFSATPRVERRLPPQRPPQPLPPLREVGPTGAPTPLALLSPAACRWPIDDPGPGMMHAALFCAGPATHGPYCAAHAALSSARPAK
ncbi:MAG TPA: GcrA family cell cycle regulator [Caulobacteraceae bacterium]|jgi:GcrA cell cycle regulator|nr:GcrA family cell cycle regulator [Caulobacteraceae bacterium]